jgi:hypothetical protein
MPALRSQVVVLVEARCTAVKIHLNIAALDFSCGGLIIFTRLIKLEDVIIQQF